MAVLAEEIVDDFAKNEFQRLLVENEALRSTAEEVARRLCYLEKLLKSRLGTSSQFKDRVKGIDTGKFALSNNSDEFLPCDLLRLLNENSWLRSEISLAEIEIFQIELTIESMQHLLDVGTPSKIARVNSKESSGTSKNASLQSIPGGKDAEAYLSEASDGEFPKIKAVFGNTRGEACDSLRRSRGCSNASSASWCSNPSKSDSRPKAPKTSAHKPASKNSAPFMGCSKTINVDSSSSVFFASLRS